MWSVRDAFVGKITLKISDQNDATIKTNMPKATNTEKMLEKNIVIYTPDI